MKTLKMTDRQSAVLESTLLKVIEAHDPDAPDELYLTKVQKNMLSRVWWNLAKLEGHAE